MAFTLNADLLAIKAELTNNPLTLSGYFPITDDTKDAANATALNLVRTELQIDRTAIPISELLVQIDRDEYANLSAADKQLLELWSGPTTINPKSGGEIREGLLQMFGAGTETRANLLAIVTESANRIEHMFKTGLLSKGGSVTASDISAARNAV